MILIQMIYLDSLSSFSVWFIFIYTLIQLRSYIWYLVVFDELYRSILVLLWPYDSLVMMVIMFR